MPIGIVRPFIWTVEVKRTTSRDTRQSTLCVLVTVRHVDRFTLRNKTGHSVAAQHPRNSTETSGR